MYLGLYILIAGAIQALTINSVDDAPITLNEIVRTLKAREAAIVSFEVKGREFACDSKGHPLADSGYQEFTWLEASEGRREFRNITRQPNGDSLQTSWYRDDGKLTYGMKSIENNPDIVNSMVLRPMENTPRRINQTKNTYINSLMPRGMLLSDLVSTSAIVSVDANMSGNRVVTLKANDKGVEMTLTLAESYDFLPVKVDFSGQISIEVTDFQNVDGFWMPKTGSKDFQDRKGQTSRLAFNAKTIRLNMMLDPNRFAPPKLENGALVYDEVKGLTRVSGYFGANDKVAYQARSRFVNRFHSERVSDSRLRNESISTQATTDPETSNLRFFLTLGSIVFLLLALWFGSQR